MPRVSRRIGSIAESATLKVDARAKQLNAQGVDVIGFAAGEPDFPTPEHIVAAAETALHDPRNYHYTPSSGLPELREAVVAKTARDSGLAVTPSQVLITNGGKQAVYEMFATLLDPGDEVLVPAPYWTTYPEAIRLAGGVPVPVFAGAESEYLVTVDQLEAATTDRTKVLLFVSPSNPTGAVYSTEQTAAIAAWADAHGLWVLADEIYQNLTYNGTTGTSIVSVAPQTLIDRIVLVNGVAKTYAMTGWRLGWAVGPADVITAAGNLQSHLTSNVSNISQRAAIAALTGTQEPAEQMRLAFDRRRHLIIDMLRTIPELHLPMPGGAFYAYPDVQALLGRTWSGVHVDTSLELADLLLDVAKVAVVPGEAFGAGGYLRLSYALGDDRLVEGTQRIIDFFARG